MPGVDRCVKRTTIGGPTTGQDIRLVVSAGILDFLLGVAEKSPTQRAEIRTAGIMVDTCRISGGHVYQMLTLEGAAPEAEIPPLLRASVGDPKRASGRFTEPPRRLPDGHNLVSRRMVGGEDDPRDFRLIVSVELLRSLRDRAVASTTRRAVVHGAGLVIDQYEDGAGRPYFVLMVMGRTPVPENPAIVAAGKSVGGF